jgi:hypothetical protein
VTHGSGPAYVRRPVLPDAERIALNLHRAYAETTGHPFDLPQALTDAITYNGHGHPFTYVTSVQ